MKTALSVATLIAVLAILGLILFNKPGVVVGATPGSDFQSPITIGGLPVYAARIPMRTATTTVCAFKSPSATSTLVYAAANFSVSSSTATTWTWGRAANAFATTTVLSSDMIIAGAAKGVIYASTTPANNLNDSKTVFGPGTFLVLSEIGGITAADPGTGFVPAGTCNAEFVAI